ncbi:hypothetical protein SeMB42_g01084 [Synchytrium endobioticum]|uniref:Uncharacterized protein n=1 Tax=Synchytrium endobioticum TaxID=286115 RepID=A0A507DNI9_9FUNG|nr:hypothetical protein SeMB42_g01084 [Synchytrium endobioticum]
MPLSDYANMRQPVQIIVERLFRRREKPRTIDLRVHKGQRCCDLKRYFDARTRVQCCSMFFNTSTISPLIKLLLLNINLKATRDLLFPITTTTTTVYSWCKDCESIEDTERHTPNKLRTMKVTILAPLFASLGLIVITHGAPVNTDLSTSLHNFELATTKLSEACASFPDKSETADLVALKVIASNIKPLFEHVQNTWATAAVSIDNAKGVCKYNFTDFKNNVGPHIDKPHAASTFQHLQDVFTGNHPAQVIDEAIFRAKDNSEDLAKLGGMSINRLKLC